ncbi:MAG: hypothetical protein R3E89_19510 [Thiolinea sp.]
MFLVRFVPEQDEELALKRLLEQIRATIEAIYDLGRFRIAIESSIGIAKSVKNVERAKDLISFANLSMFENKHSRQLNFSAQQFAKRTLDWSRRLSVIKELETNQQDTMFRLLYQPLYDTQSLQISGCEALLRFHSDVLGELMPEGLFRWRKPVG